MNKSKIILGLDIISQVALLFTAISMLIFTQEDSTVRGLKYLVIPGFYFVIIGPLNFFGNILYLLIQGNPLNNQIWRNRFLFISIIFLLATAVIALMQFAIGHWWDFFQNVMFIVAPIFALTYLAFSVREWRSLNRVNSATKK